MVVTTGKRDTYDRGLGEGNLAARFGFRFGECGTHSSRSIMLADLEQLLASLPVGATCVDYRVAVVEDNALGKSTASARLWTWTKLHTLYGLDPRLAIFRCFRQLWEVDSIARPLLAILCACTRDPVLRLSAPVVLNTPIDGVVTAQQFRDHLRATAPDRFSARTLESMGGNLLSSWTQSGHLAGKRVRRRIHPNVSPEAAAYALLLGRLTGSRGPLLFSTFWTALLDAPTETLYDLATAAARRGWIDFRRAGTVVDVGFSKLLTSEELEALHESH